MVRFLYGSFFKTIQYYENMETLGCFKKNDIRELIYDRQIPIALTPCCKSACEKGEVGVHHREKREEDQNVSVSSAKNLCDLRNRRRSGFKRIGP